jgi:hypothetical protein
MVIRLYAETTFIKSKAIKLYLYDRGLSHWHHKIHSFVYSAPH